MTDQPDGLGWFRQLVDPAERLKSLLKLEAIGFERDLRGIPIGRMPISKMNEYVKSGKLTAEQVSSMKKGLEDFVNLQRKTSDTGVVLDSQPYLNKSDTGTATSSIYEWGLDLLSGDPASLEELGKAINRLATDMALIMGTDVILTGRDGEGSRALSEDKSRNLYLNANSILVDIAEAVDRDIIEPIWALNGLPDELKPSASVEDVAFKDAQTMAQTLADMADSGAVLAPDDPAFDIIRDLMGLPPMEPIDPAMMAAMQGQPDPDADPSMKSDPNDPTASKRAWVQKLQPRPLYVQRKLINAGEVIAWAKSQGLKSTLPADDMHVTVLFSRSPVDPLKMEADWNHDDDGQMVVQAGGPRAVEMLGEEAIVLLFFSEGLKWRHSRMIEAGASHDYPEYQPHITLTYQAPDDLDLSKIEPFQGKLIFGPEIFSDLDLDWKDKISEKGGEALGPHR